MNTPIKTLVLALGLGYASHAQELSHSSEINNADYYAKMTILENTPKMRVLMVNLQNRDVIFKFKDAKKNSLYTTVLRKNKLQAHFYLNLEGLPEGIYSVEVSDKNGSTSKQFKKGAEAVVARPAETLVAIN